MKTNVELLEMYKEEKALIIGAPEERTGLEAFPSFAEWKVDYVKEYQATHVTVSEEEADAILEAAVEEAEAELANLANSFAETDDNSESEDDMTEKTETTTTKKPAAKKPAAKKPTKVKQKAANKKPVSKTVKARKIFDKYYGVKTRAEILEKFVAQCELSAAGAATYYQRFKKAA